MSAYLIERDDVVEALENASLDADVLSTAYSGRGMYGSTCLGITCTLSQFCGFLVQLALVNEDAATTLSDRVSSDSMGHSSIFYFRGVSLDGEDDES